MAIPLTSPRDLRYEAIDTVLWQLDWKLSHWAHDVSSMDALITLRRRGDHVTIRLPWDLNPVGCATLVKMTLKLGGHASPSSE